MTASQWELRMSTGEDQEEGGGERGGSLRRRECAEGANSHGWTKHQGSKSKVRVSIHESNKSGKLGGQVDRSMKLQAGREARLPADSRKGGGRNLARVAQTNVR